MKKGLLILFFVFLLSCVFFCGVLIGEFLTKNQFKNIQVNNISLNTKFLIDKKENECLQNAENSVDMLKCSAVAKEEWKIEILKNLKLLENLLPKEEYILIKNNQEEWVLQNKRDEKIIDVFIRNQGGSLYQQLAISDETEEIKNRALFLKWIYDIQYENKADN